MELSAATAEDIAFIVETENLPETRDYIRRWTSEEHAAAMRDPDTRYIISTNDTGTHIGFVILRGFQSEDRNIELKRVVMQSPGQGNGKQALRLLIKKVFEDFGAHRLWLDVFESNHRAQHVYRSLGFQQEGILREAIYRDGKYHSLLLMSLLDREYQASSNR
jgi:RimJ/RimL family protein N-acetyltransferase